MKKTTITAAILMTLSFNAMASEPSFKQLGVSPVAAHYMDQTVEHQVLGMLCEKQVWKSQAGKPTAQYVMDKAIEKEKSKGIDQGFYDKPEAKAKHKEIFAYHRARVTENGKLKPFYMYQCNKFEDIYNAEFNAGDDIPERGSVSTTNKAKVTKPAGTETSVETKTETTATQKVAPGIAAMKLKSKEAIERKKQEEAKATETNATAEQAQTPLDAAGQELIAHIKLLDHNARALYFNAVVKSKNPNHAEADANIKKLKAFIPDNYKAMRAAENKYRSLGGKSNITFNETTKWALNGLGLI